MHGRGRFSGSFGRRNPANVDTVVPRIIEEEFKTLQVRTRTATELEDSQQTILAECLWRLI